MKIIVLNCFLLIFLIFLFPVSILGQDPEFSQFFANPLHLNPAFAGTSDLPRTTLNYRNQWPNNGTTYKTYSISYDQISKKLNAGIGFQLYYDQELNNVVNTSSAAFSYSYHLKLNTLNFVTLGLQAGVVLKQFNVANLVFPSDIDQLSGEITGINSYAFGDEKKLYPDFAVGAVGQHSNFFWGASAFHINTPDESIIKGDQKGNLPVKYTIHAGLRTHRFHYGLLSREFCLSPNLMYQHQGSFKQLNLGIYVIEKSFLFGGWIRNNLDSRPDAFIALVGFAKEKFRFGYSFDYTLSKLSDYSFGSHEISLTFFLGNLNGIPLRDKLLIPMI